METMTCRLVRTTRGPSSSRARATDLPMGEPHVTVGGVGTERSCPWTRTAQGSTRLLGSSGDVWCGRYLGKEGQ